MKQLILTPHRLPPHHEQQIRRILQTIERMLKQSEYDKKR
ncbi:hypothetical protein Tola_0455 [Tolumonas auensis DSM 9187]|uniref:Uncharacterized protein n=1 Tax=Tolumonas auensis (strain DSM 9187 / NBRC 110442 / TA 4) TaxID=595494 RepID=C4L9V5_TOLAT|nr:hypothetical protein Tola_0455 [Tolumonas auensis DSM 9187]